MITIKKPELDPSVGEWGGLKCRIIDDCNKDMEVWYSVEKEYQQYLCTERADAFLLLALHKAMRSGQDIKVEVPVSAKLLFNIENTIQPLFIKSFKDHKHVNIYASSYKGPRYESLGVGGGCSLGVDSFSSLLKHMGENVVDGYRLTHLCLFNCGQLGDTDVKGAEQNLKDSVEDIKPFANDVSLPILQINTNINEYYSDSGVRLLQSFVCRTMSCVLILQKLFSKYVYSSSYSIENFQISRSDESHMEAAFVPLLGTEDTEIILSNPVMTRVEKTVFISEFPITERYLDVCWAKQWAYGFINITEVLDEKINKNCGRCDKCMRTILTLDLLGKLDRYEGLFDMVYYRNNKMDYIHRVVLNSDEKVFYKEITDLLIEKNIELPYKTSFYIRKDKLSRILKMLYKFIRRFKLRLFGKHKEKLFYNK